MRVLGVDPGLTRCGVGVVEGGPGISLRLIGTTAITTPADADIGRRLLMIEEQLDEWLAKYQPDAVAVERVFSQHNVRTVMGTAQAGAVAIVCAARRGLPVALHTPSEVKAAVTGNGRADKAQVTHMVARLLRLADRPSRLTRPTRWRWRSVICGAAVPVPGWRPRQLESGPGRDPMIAHLDGVVSTVAPEGAVIDVGGVGLLVQCSPGTLAGLRPGERAKVSTSLVVREDSLTLFGFGTDDERNTFELLQTASGIGPRLALAMLATFSPDGLRSAGAWDVENADAGARNRQQGRPADRA